MPELGLSYLAALSPFSTLSSPKNDLRGGSHKERESKDLSRLKKLPDCSLPINS